MTIRLVALLLCCLVLFACSNPEEEATAQYNEARLAKVDGKIDDYEAALRLLVEKYPQTKTASTAISELEEIKAEKAALALMRKLSQERAEQGMVVIKKLKGSFVKNSQAGELFVIYGEATNTGLKDKADAKLIGRIFNNNNEIVKEQIASAGVFFDEETLKTKSILLMLKEMERGKGPVLKSNSPQPFTIVFDNLGKDIKEFSVNVEGQ